jgi:hypothetical protein
MNWLVFSYSLSAAQRSSPRVAVWRRLRAVGAVSPKSGVYVLPAREECVEAFQWLAQEVEQAQGEAVLMRVQDFEGLSEAQLIGLFRTARRHDYQALDAKAAVLEKSIRGKGAGRPQDLTRARDALAKLRREHADIARIDFFDAPERGRVAARLARIAQALSPAQPPRTAVAPAAVAAYREKRWVTRPHPHVDRLACIWLIRRFINPDAVIRYASSPEPDEVAFDMGHGEFGHRGNLCTFETMLTAFGLDDPGLRAIAEVVHEIDLRDGRSVRPEVAGVDAILTGWQALSDADREAHGVALFDGLYATLSQAGPRKKSRWPGTDARAPRGDRSRSKADGC